MGDKWVEVGNQPLGNLLKAKACLPEQEAAFVAHSMAMWQVLLGGARLR